MNPYLIQFEGSNEPDGSSLSFVEGRNIPFDVKRVYWTYGVNVGDKRGGHAHKSSDRLLVCTFGSAEVKLQNNRGEKFTFKLDEASKGLVFPANHWIDIEFMEQSVLMVLVSCTYEEDIYLKDYEQFLSK